MESPKHQEWRSRQRLSWSAVWQTALAVGGLLFIMSGGSPWSTAGTMNAIMGRDLPIGFAALLILHFALSFVYTAIIALVIYRLRTGAAIPAGVGAALGLYALNYASFYGLGVQMQSPEFRAIFVHVTFGLFASVVYKAASVPRPIRGGDREVEAITEEMHVRDFAREGDPEPELVAHHA